MSVPVLVLYIFTCRFNYKVLAETDFAAMCEICSLWFHMKCQDVADAVYKILCQHDALHWYCKQCSKGAEKVLGLISGLQIKAVKLEEGLSKLDKDFRKEIDEMKIGMEVENKKLTDEMKAMKEEIDVKVSELVLMFDDKLENKMNTKEDVAKKENTTLWSEVVKAVDTKFSEVQDSVAKVNAEVAEAKVKMENQRDKESREKHCFI